MKNYTIEGHLTATQPLATCSKSLMDQEGGSTKPTPIPSLYVRNGNLTEKRLYFPATGIRGSLRRALRDVLRNAIIKKTNNPTPLSLDEHYFLTLGGIKGQGKQERHSVADLEMWRAKNPLLSLFGAGDAGYLGFVAGHLLIGNAICTEPSASTTFAGARTDDIYRDPAQIRFLSQEDIDSLVKRAVGGRNRSAISAQIKAAEKLLDKARKDKDTAIETQIREEIEKLQTEQQQVKETTGTSDVSVGMPLAGFEAIPVGSQLENKMILRHSNAIELGALLHALNKFGEMPILGAHAAQGCGLVSGEWNVYEITPESKNLIGQITLTPFEPLSVMGECLDDAMQNFVDFLESDELNISIPKAA